MYLDKDVDKQGNMVDFSLTIWTNELAAHKFLLKAIANNGCPKLINIDKSGANKEFTSMEEQAHRHIEQKLIRLQETGCVNLSKIISETILLLFALWEGRYP